MSNICGWFIYSKYGLDKNKKFLETMKEKALKHGVNVKIFCTEDFYIVSDKVNEVYYNGEKIIDFPDFVFLRAYSLALGRQFESLGIKVINSPDMMEITKNKFTTHQILVENDILTPKTFVFLEKGIDYKKISGLLGEKFIAKNNTGSQGKGVYLIENENDFQKIKDGKNYIFQEYIETTKGRDLRVYVLGGEILGCVMRKAKDDKEFRANLSVGGDAVAYPLSKEIEEVCLKVAEVFELDFTGIDLLFTDSGYTVCEVNSMVGFKSLRALNGVAFSDKFYEYVKKNVL